MTIRQRGRKALVVEELGGVELGDPRRGRRGLAVAERLAAQPDASLPGAMADRAMLEGLYRHLSNGRVSFEALIEPHLRRCAARVGESGDVYAVHDTTFCTFRGESKRAGLGRIIDKEQGFMAHVTLAVSADSDRLPLGVLGTELFVRGDRIGKRSSKARKRDGARESLRWGRGVEQASSRVQAPGRLIHVADREGAIYELLVDLVAQERRFIIRATQDRPVNVDGTLSTLFEAAQETAPAYAVEVPLSRRRKTRWTRRSHHPPRRRRTAQLTMAALTVKLRRPDRSAKGMPKWLQVNAVHVFEIWPPPGEPAVEWLLLTSEPIAEQHDIARVVEGYRTRWTIEEFFKAVKTGCAYEARQLESFRALSNLFAYTLVIAYAMLLMRALGRANRSLPADAVLSETEIEVLRRVKKGHLPEDPNVRDALLAIAALGGHIRNNGDPGWRVLSRGWQRLRDYEAGYRMAKGDL